MDTTSDGFGAALPPHIKVPNLDDLKALFEKHISKEAALMEVANIVVAGNAGVGKSTLINSMFGAEFAKTGIGRPITPHVERISVPGKPLVLYDTRGLEVQKSDETISELSGLIKSLREKENSGEQIHCLWMCIAADSNRTEDAHRTIYQICRTYRVPVIVVLTKDYLGSDEFEAHVWGEFPDSHDVIPIVAQERSGPRGTILSFGLERLLDATLRAMPDAVKASVEFAQVAVRKRKIDAARKVVNWSAGTGLATALPLAVIPFAHMAVLVPLQINMIVQINRALGVDMSEDDSKALVGGLVGVILAAVGGKMAFVELIKFIPGAGTAVGMAIGGGVAGAVVKALGEIYISYITEFVDSGAPLDPTAILEGLKNRIKNEAWRFNQST